MDDFMKRWVNEKVVFLKIEILLVYIDDVLVFLKIKEEHAKHLKIIMNEFLEHGIVLSPRKMEIIIDEIEYFGMILNHKGIKSNHMS